MHPEVLVAAAVLLALERATYIWIYRKPQAFEAWAAHVQPFANVSPIEAVAYLFALFKVIQLSVFAWWCWAHGDGVPVSIAPHGAAIASGAVLIAAGQYLNMRVFTLLGRTGVFYGDRFGMALPWRTDFPFSVLAHPQYVGTCLSIWGIFLILRFPQPDWYVLPVLETVYYAAGSLLEQ